MSKLKLKDISIRLKIIILSVIVLVFAMSLFLHFNAFQREININKNYLTKTYLQKNNLINNSQRIINSFIVFNHISYEKLDDFIDIQNSFFQTNDSILQITKKYENLTNNVNENLTLDEFSLEYQIFQNIIYEIFNEYKKEEISLKNISRLFNKELLSYQNLISILKKLKQQNNNSFGISIDSMEKNITQIIIRILFSFLLFLGLFIVLSIVFFKENLKLPQIIEPYLNRLSSGETIKISVEDEKEKSVSLKSIKQINDNYKRINNYINELKNKNYEFELKSLGKNDVISNTIQSLKDQLIESQKEIEIRQKSDKQKEWANTGINMFSELMRQHSNNLTILSDEIIKALVKYLEASVGGLFIVQNPEKEEPYLELLAAFAYDRKKYYSKRIYFGEGLIGTVAIDQTTIHLNKIPSDYLEIESGLGDSPPNNLLILPLLTDNGLLGIIEIAALRNFEDFEIEFSETLSRSVASTLEAVKINARTVELLKESQKKSDELSAREKILQETMEEVNKAHQSAKRNEIEMTGILTGVDQTLMRAEYSVDGKFINSNFVHRQTMGYDIEQMKGKNILEFIQEEEKENFKKLWSEVSSGKPYQITVKRQNKQTGADIWLLNQYTPIKDDKGKVIKVLYLAIDITEQKVAEEKSNALLIETQEKEVELKGVLSGIDRTIMRAEYTVEGNFISSNEVHRRIMGYELKNMIGKSILDFIQEDQKEEFNKLWREVGLGKAKELTVKRVNRSTGKDIWLINQYNPILDENNKVTKILYLAIDITEQKVAEARAQELLKQTQQKEHELRGLFIGIDQAIMRAEYSPDGAFIDANEIHVQTLGYDIAKMKGQNIINFIPEEDKEEFTEVWNSVKEGNLEQITVKRINQSTGDEIWLLNQYTPIEDENGKIVKILYLAIDISEQKVAENIAAELLTSSQEKELELSGILSGVDQAIMRAEYTAEGTFIDSNDIHVKTLGYDKAQMTGKNILEFIEDNDKEEFIKTWESVKKGNLEHLTVKRTNKETGEDVWLLNQYTPIKNKAGDVIKVLYLAINISEQKQAEQKAVDLLIDAQLKELELKGILAGIDRTIMRARYSVEGLFFESNEVHRNIMGYKIENMLGKNILEFIPEEEKEDFQKMWTELTQGNQKELVVKRFNKTTNKTIWLKNQYNPIFDSSGRVIEVLYLGIDITEEKRLEQSSVELLAKSQENEIELSALFTAVDQTLMRAEYTPEGLFISSNHIHVDTMGYDPETMIGKNILEFIIEEERDDFIKLWKSVVDGNLEQIVVKRKNKKTDEDIWLLNQYTPVKDNEGKISKILYLAFDISEQKRLEQELTVQEQIMTQNMDELFKEFQQVEEENERLKELEEEIAEQFDTEQDKLYKDWLDSLE
ncbi:MAG: PAS domain S-box protein [Bacteroidales bacterium]|nr:PAS domain S-box protein [Bacteroidales bacterium]